MKTSEKDISSAGLAITKTQPLSGEIAVANLFDKMHSDAHLSPIDQYIVNNNNINLIYSHTSTVSPVMASVLLLGYMSAVESYVRAVIRGLINVDVTCRKSVEAHQISFAAAISHQIAILPEALLEEVSFASGENIKKSLGKYLGLALNNFNGMEKHFEEFDKLCQLRHCSTHRFGKLGTKNWLALGLSDHKNLLEKPLSLTKNDVETAAIILRTFVKNLNNVIFDAVLARTVTGGKTSNQLQVTKVDWKWVYKTDKSKFEKYYRLFYSTEDASPSDAVGEVYKKFVLLFKPS